jgi:hypothetical protein
MIVRLTTTAIVLAVGFATASPSARAQSAQDGATRILNVFGARIDAPVQGPGGLFGASPVAPDAAVTGSIVPRQRLRGEPAFTADRHRPIAVGPDGFPGE